MYAVPTVALRMGRLKPEALDDDWPPPVEVDAWVSFDSCFAVPEDFEDFEDFDVWEDSAGFEDCDSCGLEDERDVSLDAARSPMVSFSPGG